ncbi:hypothetical protein [Cellvibrio sp. NN19]|uniref:hypothetical protein n=1 Tax=Cellvibrio chitinivorans TaxID=3102792 RepID=UPI002B4075DC|nr:hypothetical protein [Cellvibrio sp. NN19]
MTNKFKFGLISVSVMTLVACGGGGSGGGNKSSAPTSSVAPISSSSSSISSVTSSAPATSSSSSVVEASSSSVENSSVEASSSSSSDANSSSMESSSSQTGGTISSTPTTSSSSSPVATSSSSVASSSVVSSSSINSSSSSMDSSSSLNNSSSNSSSSAAAGTTTFTVTISSPELDDVAALAKTGRSAKAHKTEEILPLNQLAVVVVDLAGNVLETIPLDENNSSQNADGSWSINVPGYPQLDCIVVADLNGPITVFQPGENVFESSDLLLTPTTSEDLEVSLASTAAYQNFLDSLGGEGTFDDLGLDVNDPTQLTVLQNLIETVADVLEDQVFVGATSITQALAQVQQQVAGIVQVEATNVTNSLPLATNTLATGLSAGGGIYWIEGYEPSEIYYGGFPALNTPEQEQYYDGETFQLLPEYELDGQVVLTESGWVISNDIFQATALNEDGSVTLGAADAPTNSVNAKATQVINLSGRSISTFFNAYGDTRGLVSQINPANNFAQGALGYRITIQSTNELYTLWYNAGYDYGNGLICPWDKNGDGELNDSPSSFGGNCETVNYVGWTAEGWAQTSSVLETLAELISPDVEPGTQGAKLVTIDWPNGEVIGVQLLDNDDKTVHFYLHNWNESSPTLLATTTWSQLTLPYLEGDEANAIGFAIPESVLAVGDFDSDEHYVVFTVHDGLVRRGDKADEGETLETGTLVLNGAAKNNLLAAFDYQPAIAGTWVIGGDYLMFRKDGTFAQVKVSNEDPNCQPGVAYGSYSWNATTGAFSVDLDTDTTAVDPQDSCSASGVETATISGSSMTMTEGEDTFALTKVTPSESAPLAGAWAVSGSGDWFTFTADNGFIHAKIENDDPECQIGWANGSFTWNAETGLLSATVDQDYTDDYPDDTCTLEGDITATLDGNTLSFSADDDNFTMKRFGNPLN